jgi:hypothetical protein
MLPSLREVPDVAAQGTTAAVVRERLHPLLGVGVYLPGCHRVLLDNDSKTPRAIHPSPTMNPASGALVVQPSGRPAR